MKYKTILCSLNLDFDAVKIMHTACLIV